MWYSRQDGEPGRALGGTYLWPARWRTFGFWLGCLITFFLVGAGLAGLALGHSYAGGAALFFGFVSLAVGARNLARQRNRSRPSGTWRG